MSDKTDPLDEFAQTETPHEDRIVTTRGDAALIPDPRTTTEVPF